MDNKLKYGLFIGIFFFLSLLLEYYTHVIVKGPFYSIIWFVPAYFILIFVSINVKRRKNGGQITLGDGFRNGLGTAVLGTLLSSVAVYIFYKFIDHDSVNVFAATTRKALEAKHLEPDKITDQVNDFISNFASEASTYTLALMLFAGALVSLIISAVMSTIKKPA